MQVSSRGTRPMLTSFPTAIPFTIPPTNLLATIGDVLSSSSFTQQFSSALQTTLGAAASAPGLQVNVQPVGIPSTGTRQFVVTLSGPPPVSLTTAAIPVAGPGTTTGSVSATTHPSARPLTEQDA